MVGQAHRDAARPFWPRLRVRRPSDRVRLGLVGAAAVVVVLLVYADPGLPGEVARVVPDGLRRLPRGVLSAANVVASLGMLGVLVAVLADALRVRRFALTSALLALTLALAVTALLAELSDSAGWRGSAALLAGPDRPAALPVAAAVAVLTGADLQRRRRWLRPARTAVVVAVVVALALGSLSVAGAAVAVLLGAASGLLVRVVLGVVPARPGPDELLAVLGAAGFGTGSMRLIEEHPGRARYAAACPGRPDLLVTVVDPDGRGVSVVSRVWRTARLRTAAVGRPVLSLRGELERTALAAALAHTAGVAAPHVLALLSGGPALVLVEQPLAGTPLSLAGDGSAQGLGAAFAALRRFHRAGLAHGALSGDAVLLLPDGSAGFADLATAQLGTTPLQRQLDVVALLVAGAAQVGAVEAVRALHTTYDPAGDAALEMLLQPIALPAPTRAAARRTPVVDDLRAALAGGAPAGAHPTPQRLERLRPRTVLSLAAATVGLHVLATQLSKVGLAGALHSAHPGWLAVALLGSAVTYPGAALALRAFVPAALPLARTTLVQLASSFLTLVTPPSVGHVGLNIRFLQRAGLPTATATASVAVSQSATVVVTVAVLLLCSWLSGVSASRPALLPSGSVLVILAAAAVALALVAAAPPSRRLLRPRLEPFVRRALPQLLATVTSPRRLAEAVVGVLVLTGGYVLALDASLRAFSTSVALPALVVVYLAASTVGSAAPTPGGLGAVEAALVGGLTATGVPVAPALTAVLAFRTATFWLPAPVGWLALVALQRREHL